MMSTFYLTRFFLKIDFRNRDEKKLSKIITVIISYLFANVLLSANAYLLLDKDSFALVSFSTAMFLLVLLVLGEYDGLFFEKSHFDFINGLPLKNQHLFLSKFLSAACYLMMFVLVLVIPQSIFFYYYDKNYFDVIWFIIVNSLFTIFSISWVVVLYTVALLVFRKTRFFIHLFQIAFIFYVLGINSIASEAIKFGRGNLITFTAIKYTPQYFFLKSFEGGISAWMVLVATILTFLTMYFLLTKKYVLISKILKEQDFRRKPYLHFQSILLFQSIENILLKNNNTQAGYFLASNMFLRSRTLRMRIFPMVMLPLLFTIVMVITNQDGIFFNSSQSSGLFKTEIKVFVPSITLVLLLSSRLFLKNLLYSEGSTSMIEFYKALPITNNKLFWKGTIIFALVFIQLPVFITISICLSFVGSVTDVIANIVFVFSFIIFLNSLNLINIKTLPFSIPSSKYSSLARLGDVIIMSAIGVVFFFFQIFAFKSTIAFILVTLVLFVFLEIFLRIKK